MLPAPKYCHTSQPPFGMLIKDRSYTSDTYRFGFQAQEKDDEINGDGNSYAFEYRIHDPRLGRFLSIDPLSRDYPWNSPYAFSENRLIDAVELEGLEKVLVFGGADFGIGNPYGRAASDVATLVKDGVDKKTNVEIVLINSNASAIVSVVVAAVKEIVDNYDPNQPLVLYGFSLGGAVAQMVARELDNRGIKVDLLVTVDAAMSEMDVDRSIPDNVVKNVNYYQTKPSIIRSRGGANTAVDKNKTEIQNRDLTGMVATVDGKKEDVIHRNIGIVTEKEASKEIIDAIQ